MLEDKIKAFIGELAFQNIVLVHKNEELQKQLTAATQPTGETSEV